MLIVYHVLYILLILNYNCIYAYNIYIYYNIKKYRYSKNIIMQSP